MNLFNKEETVNLIFLIQWKKGFVSNFTIASIDKKHPLNKKIAHVKYQRTRIEIISD